MLTLKLKREIIRMNTTKSILLRISKNNFNNNNQSNSQRNNQNQRNNNQNQNR